jgi:hypothetical protein
MYSCSLKLLPLLLSSLLDLHIFSWVSINGAMLSVSLVTTTWDKLRLWIEGDGHCIWRVSVITFNKQLRQLTRNDLLV